MFLDNYLDDVKLELLYSTYDDWYLEGLDEENFVNVYNVFKKYNFYFIDDIILNYLEIFELDPFDVDNKLIEFKNRLGDKFVYIIGEDMRYLEEILGID